MDAAVPRSLQLPSILPDDLPAMKALLLDYSRAVQEEFGKLNHSLEVLRKYVFGRRSEKIPVSDQQLLFPELEAAPHPVIERSGEKETISYERYKKGKRVVRGVIPEDLPRKDTVIEPSQEELFCCGKPRKYIGDEISQQLAFNQASFFVKRTIRPKYACETCETGVVIAPLPPMFMPKGLYDYTTAVQVVVSKYVDHLPLYRQEMIYARQGIPIPRSSMVGMVEAIAQYCRPIYEVLVAQMRASYCKYGDDTVALVVDENGRTRGYTWCYVGDESVVYEFTPTRSADGPAKMLAKCTGALMSDGTSLFNKAINQSNGKLVQVCCWSHTRRYFYEARDQNKELATYALEKIAALYMAEREIKEHKFQNDPERVKQIRQEKSGPVLEQLFAWAESKRKSVMPKSAMGTAFEYLLNRRVQLSRHLDDGRLPIDNNLTERNIRPVVIGRKNYMFFGSEDGAGWGMIMYSLFATCRMHGVNHCDYLCWLIAKIITGPPKTSYEDLTPQAYKKTLHPP